MSDVNIVLSLLPFSWNCGHLGGFFFSFFNSRASQQTQRHKDKQRLSPPRTERYDKYSILSWEPMVVLVSHLSPIVADCCSHAVISYPFRLCLTILQQHLLLYGIILSNYYNYLIQYTTSSPPHLPLLLSPAFVIRCPSSATCFCCNLVACCLHHHPLLSHRPQSPSDVVASLPYPSGLVASSTASRPRDDIAATIIAATPCHPLLVVCSRHVVHPPPTVSPQPRPRSNRSRRTFRRPLSLRRPTASATTSTLPLSPLSPDAVVARR